MIKDPPYVPLLLFPSPQKSSLHTSPMGPIHAAFKAYYPDFIKDDNFYCFIYFYLTTLRSLFISPFEVLPHFHVKKDTSGWISEQVSYP